MYVDTFVKAFGAYRGVWGWGHCWVCAWVLVYGSFSFVRFLFIYLLLTCAALGGLEKSSTVTYACGYALEGPAFVGVPAS